MFICTINTKNYKAIGHSRFPKTLTFKLGQAGAEYTTFSYLSCENEF